MEGFASYLTANVVTEKPLGFGPFVGAKKLVFHAPDSIDLP